MVLLATGLLQQQQQHGGEGGSTAPSTPRSARYAASSVAPSVNGDAE